MTSVVQTLCYEAMRILFCGQRKQKWWLYSSISSLPCQSSTRVHNSTTTHAWGAAEAGFSVCSVERPSLVVRRLYILSPTSKAGQKLASYHLCQNLRLCYVQHVSSSACEQGAAHLGFSSDRGSCMNMCRGTVVTVSLLLMYQKQHCHYSPEH